MSRPVKKNNIALLTEGQKYIDRAKKARREQVEEVKFDDEARREWLTGFSKRKKAKTDERRARAKERDHQAHLDERRKMRQELRERAAQNVKDVRRAMGLEDLEDAPEAGPSKPVEEEAEYSDEDQLATVTIIEDFDPAKFTSLPARIRSSTSPDAENEPKKAVPLLPASSHKAQQKAKREKDKVKKKSEKVKVMSMETQAERKKGRQMETKRRIHKGQIALERDGKTSHGRSVRGKSSRGRGGSRGGSGRGRGGKK